MKFKPGDICITEQGTKKILVKILKNHCVKSYVKVLYLRDNEKGFVLKESLMPAGIEDLLLV